MDKFPDNPSTPDNAESSSESTESSRVFSPGDIGLLDLRPGDRVEGFESPEQLDKYVADAAAILGRGLSIDKVRELVSERLRPRGFFGKAINLAIIGEAPYRDSRPLSKPTTFRVIFDMYTQGKGIRGPGAQRFTISLSRIRHAANEMPPVGIKINPLTHAESGEAIIRHENSWAGVGPVRSRRRH